MYYKIISSRANSPSHSQAVSHDHSCRNPHDDSRGDRLAPYRYLYRIDTTPKLTVELVSQEMEKFFKENPKLETIEFVRACLFFRSVFDLLPKIIIQNHVLQATRQSASKPLKAQEDPDTSQPRKKRIISPSPLDTLGSVLQPSDSQMPEQHSLLPQLNIDPNTTPAILEKAMSELYPIPIKTCLIERVIIKKAELTGQHALICKEILGNIASGAGGLEEHKTKLLELVSTILHTTNKVQDFIDVAIHSLNLHCHSYYFLHQKSDYLGKNPAVFVNFAEQLINEAHQFIGEKMEQYFLDESHDNFDDLHDSNVSEQNPANLASSKAADTPASSSPVLAITPENYADLSMAAFSRSQQNFENSTLKNKSVNLAKKFACETFKGKELVTYSLMKIIANKIHTYLENDHNRQENGQSIKNYLQKKHSENGHLLSNATYDQKLATSYAMLNVIDAINFIFAINKSNGLRQFQGLPTDINWFNQDLKTLFIQKTLPALAARISYEKSKQSRQKETPEVLPDACVKQMISILTAEAKQYTRKTLDTRQFPGSGATPGRPRFRNNASDHSSSAHSSDERKGPRPESNNENSRQLSRTQRAKRAIRQFGTSTSRFIRGCVENASSRLRAQNGYATFREWVSGRRKKYLGGKTHDV